MRWFWLVLFAAVPCYGITQIFQDYSDKSNILKEYQNIIDNAQDKSFTQVVGSTPSYQDMKDGEIFIYVSTPAAADAKLMLRIGTTVYASPVFPIIKGR